MQDVSFDLATLTAMEHAVLELMAEGLSNRGIAERLHYTEATVEKTATRVLWKVTGRVHEQRPLVNRRVLAVLAYREVI